MRRKLSLLLANGHPDAASYPLGFLNDEAHLIVERENGLTAAQALATRSAVASVVDSAFGGKKAHETFKQLIKQLIGE